MAKILKFDSEAREKLLKGVNTLTEAVAATLGPKGRNVAIDKKWGAPNVIHDGVTVAKEIELADPFENMGAQLVKEAASKTNDVAGDGKQQPHFWRNQSSTSDSKMLPPALTQ